MQISHNLLIEIINTLDLPKSGGICHGYAVLFAQFYCDLREDEFIEIMSELKAFNNEEQLLTHLESVGDDSKLKSFFIELCHIQDPNDFVDLFEGLYRQINIQEISEKLSLTSKVIKQIPLLSVYKDVFMLNEQELVGYFSQLAEKLTTCSEIPFTILLGNEQHRVAITYDPAIKLWSNRDVNYVCEDDYQITFYDLNGIVRSLFKSLEDKEYPDESDFIGFDINIVASKALLKPNHAEVFSDLGSTILNPEINSVDRVNSSHVNLLLMAVLNNCTEKVRELLKNEHWSINDNTLADGHSCLHVAVSYNEIKLIEILLNYKNTDVNVSNHYGNTPLILACLDGNVELVKLLLAHPAINPNVCNNQLETPLHIASSLKSNKILKLLLEHPSIEPNVYNDLSQTPLYITCLNNDPKKADLLLNHELIDPNSLDDSGQTPLHLACLSNNAVLVSLLIAHPKIETGWSNSFSMTPLGLCVSALLNQIDIAMLLFAHQGIDLNRLDAVESLPNEVVELEHQGALIDSLKVYDEYFTAKRPTTPAMNEQPSRGDTSNTFATGIGFQVFGGFIAVLGIAAVAVGFVMLQAVTFGLPILAGIGCAGLVTGIGFFSAGTARVIHSHFQPEFMVNTV